MNWKMHHFSYLLSNWLDFIIERMEVKKKKKPIPKTKETKVVGKKWKWSESESFGGSKWWKESESSEFEAVVTATKKTKGEKARPRWS